MYASGVALDATSPSWESATGEAVSVQSSTSSRTILAEVPSIAQSRDVLPVVLSTDLKYR